MFVRIRFRYGPRVSRRTGKNRHVALAAAALLTPAALTACALGFWRLAADLGVVGRFAITGGLFSHWQAWLALGILVESAAIVLNRYGRGRALLRNSGESSDKSLLNSEYSA